MMPPPLNLLPPQRRRAFDQVLILTSIRKALIVIGICFGIAILVILAASYTLNRELKAQQHITAQSLEQTTKANGASLDEQIRAFNVKLAEVNALQQDTVRWTPLLHELFSTIPDGITLARVSIDGTAKLLLIHGTAKDRDALLVWQEALTAAPHYENPSSPIATLLQKEDIEFDLEVTLVLP